VRIKVGGRICAERKAQNLSQADLERRCGLARCRISWLEHGRAVPTLETLERIADALEIPVHQLLSNGDERTQGSKASGKIATSGSRRRSQKNGVRLLRELREQMTRMREDDQQLLLFIARKMARRGREPNGGMIAGREDGKS